MSTKRRLMYCALAMVLLLSCIGIYSHCQRKPVTESVERDTVVVYDTIPHYYPKPVAEEHVRYVTRYLPVAQPVGTTDTMTLWLHDTVAVVVPITSKHYSCKDYDAWVSGYEPSLDSIFVYRQREFITETVTRMKPPNRFTIGIQGGYGYGFKSKALEPYVGIGIGIRIY